MVQIPIVVAEGDGIGPEIMKAVLQILQEAGAPLEIHKIEIGERLYKQGFPTGMNPASWDLLRTHQVFLKAPITTPQGKGYKSLNVTIRTMLGLYANIRPCVAYSPFVRTKYPGMNVTIVRENEEDLYTGIEYRPTVQMTQSLKLISRPGSERIIRYAFEYARQHNRKKVTCFTKDNILKMSDGLFHRIFDEIASQYSDLQNEHYIVDIGAARLSDTPERFDVVVLPNLYGDILSDVAAQIAGSVGLAGSANIGQQGAMFEAIHGSAPARAGQDKANPSGLLLAGIMMLVHLKQYETATQIHNAWLRTLEDGIHTYDIFQENKSTALVGTQAFAQAVVKRLGQKPQQLPEAMYTATPTNLVDAQTVPVVSSARLKKLVGVDFYLDWAGQQPELLAKHVQSLRRGPMELQTITNRGMIAWPTIIPGLSYVDHWRCRFFSKDVLSQQDIAHLLEDAIQSGLDVVQTQNLYTFDGELGYVSAYGEA